MPHMTQAEINQAAADHGFLDPNDAVAISFWIISIAMVAATVFFLIDGVHRRDEKCVRVPVHVFACVQGS